MFRQGFEQHDSAEFTRMFLDQIEQASKQVEPHLAYNFIGQICTSTKCESCLNVSEQLEDFVDIQVPALEKLTVANLVEETFKQ